MTNHHHCGQHYDASYFMRILLALCTVANVFAFQASPLFFRSPASCSSSASIRPNKIMEMGMVAVDPSVVTKKEMDDIVGVDFDKDSMHKRLQTNVFLYPKHVEVIEDIAPIADRMVDEIVSVVYNCSSCILSSFLPRMKIDTGPVWLTISSTLYIIENTSFYLGLLTFLNCVASGNWRRSMAATRFPSRSFQGRLGR